MSAPLEAPDAVQRWSALALEQDWPKDWVEGAIFACEMVYFLAACEAAGIRRVIESGRQDGYSTRILGEYAKRTGIAVVSIDFEDDPARAAKCHAMLAPYGLDLRKGNAFEAVVAAVREAREPTALLIDGPKGFLAQSMAFAAQANGPVELVAFHNLNEGSVWRSQFEELAGPAAFYETALAADASEAWMQLRKREIAACEATGARRSLEKSSLGVMRVDAAVERRLRRLVRAHYGLVQPPMIAALWRLGWDRFAYALYVGAVKLGQI
jgi:hypothetical protein